MSVKGIAPVSRVAAASALLVAAVSLPALIELSRAEAAGLEVALTAGTGGIALVMGPTGIPDPSDGYVTTAERLYLQPLGFTGTAESLYTPEASGNTDVGLADDVKYIMAAVHKQLATGEVNGDNPIWLFGYSQSAAAAALAAQQLHAEGVAAENLHFVLLGDGASAHGGLLNSLLPSLPDWLRSWVEPLLPMFGLQDSMGLTHPDYYPTDIYTISNDGYANWPADISDLNATLNALGGMFSSHLYYLGPSPEQIPSPSDPDFTDGLANYYTIDADSINGWDALVQAGVNLEIISAELGQFLTAF